MTHDFPEPWWQAPRPPAEAVNTQEHIRSTQVTGGRSTTGARGSRGNNEKEEHIRSMRRNVKKSLWMSQEELWDLKEKAQAACLTESEFIRQRIAGYTPPQQVDDRFWKAMDIMREFADTIDKVAMKADNSVDMIALMTEAKKWRMLQNAIEKELLRPKRSDG